jgi:plasmid stabilization system protein ParE
LPGKPLASNALACLREAEEDLDEIFLYWASRASLEAADRIIDRITESVSGCSENIQMRASPQAASLAV